MGDETSAALSGAADCTVSKIPVGALLTMRSPGSQPDALGGGRSSAVTLLREGGRAGERESVRG